eukprot:scaffold179037_cov37-Tisochrysis_lutea.AAC.1
MRCIRLGDVARSLGSPIRMSDGEWLIAFIRFERAASEAAQRAANGWEGPSERGGHTHVRGVYRPG